MKRVPIADFKAHCSQYIDELGQEEIVITKHGKPVARVVAEPKALDTFWDFYGALKGKVYVDLNDDLLSTGRVWDAQSWRTTPTDTEDGSASSNSGQNF